MLAAAACQTFTWALLPSVWDCEPSRMRRRERLAGVSAAASSARGSCADTGPKYCAHQSSSSNPTRPNGRSPDVFAPVCRVPSRGGLPQPHRAPTLRGVASCRLPCRLPPPPLRRDARPFSPCPWFSSWDTALPRAPLPFLLAFYLPSPLKLPMARASSHSPWCSSSAGYVRSSTSTGTTYAAVKPLSPGWRSCLGELCYTDRG